MKSCKVDKHIVYKKNDLSLSVAKRQCAYRERLMRLGDCDEKATMDWQLQQSEYFVFSRALRYHNENFLADFSLNVKT
jgi:hypothetical protein